jgi:uncharacterized membrane protein YjgN (DUF898 family)
MESMTENLPGSTDAAPETPRRITRRHVPVFTGSGAEYFRIWIVNVALTLLTLGIYGAWAKVRTRRYFYAHTLLDGQPFDYHARPEALLKGYCIVFGAVMAMNLANQFLAVLGIVLTVLFWSGVPFLIHSAFRFKAKNASWRGLRFRFHGTLKECYATYGLWGVVAFLSAGLAYPYWIFRRKQYFFDNFSYGGERARFGGELEPFYLIYLRASGLVLLFLAVCAIVAAGAVGATTPDLTSQEGVAKLIAGLAVSTFAVFLFASVVVRHYLDARVTNYTWSNTTLGPVRFASTVRARDLIWLSFSILALIVLTLGFYAPWAFVRWQRYRLSRLAVMAVPEDLAAFQAAGAESDVTATGDAAADFFDWDIGF